MFEMNAIFWFIFFTSWACRVNSLSHRPYDQVQKVSPKKQDDDRRDSVEKKTNYLAQVFRKKMEILKSANEVELVFLVDGSYSIGPDNFLSEIKFIQKVISDVKVGPGDFRLGVVIYSKNASIHVDHLSMTDNSDLQKCSLLHYDIPGIVYPGSNTNTKEALEKAEKILTRARKGALKVVFLVTDGFSNMGNPLPAADILKEQGIIIFTFGIENGNVRELKAIATKPTGEHTFLFHSFDEFEGFGRRALHQDLSPGVYVPAKNSSLCDKLCSAGSTTNTHGGCCSEESTCSCGLISGHFACLCPPGYYGSGLVGEGCTLCPEGTYGEGLFPGDSLTGCTSCPDVHHKIARYPATSKAHCVCDDDTVPDGEDKCKVVSCPPLLSPPLNGYFVKKNCSNVINAACGVRCHMGYVLTGSSVRICQKNGTWSGIVPVCMPKYCDSLKPVAGSQVNCINDEDMVGTTLVYDSKGNEIQRQQFSLTNESSRISDRWPDRFNGSEYAVGTTCSYTCLPGRSMIGSKSRGCLPMLKWSGLKPTCKSIKCPSLPEITSGSIKPQNCTLKGVRHSFGDVCRFHCNPGYDLKGPKLTNCTGKHGSWSTKNSPSRCVDVEPPRIDCPSDVSVKTDEEVHYATVELTLPNTTDNSGKEPVIWSKPAFENGHPLRLNIGETRIEIYSVDETGNYGFCSFTITVKDEEKPKVLECQSPPAFYVSDFLNYKSSSFSWKEPVFDDNSGIPITVVRDPFTTTDLPVGLTTPVTYTAIDGAGNSATCTLNITILDNPCTQRPKNSNTLWNCSVDLFSVTTCIVSCSSGFGLVIPNAENTVTLTCTFSGSKAHWYPDAFDEDLDLFPECSTISLPEEMDEILIEDPSDLCNDSNGVTRDFINEIVADEENTSIYAYCEDESDWNEDENDENGFVVDDDNDDDNDDGDDYGVNDKDVSDSPVGKSSEPNNLKVDDDNSNKTTLKSYETTTQEQTTAATSTSTEDNERNSFEITSDIQTTTELVADEEEINNNNNRKLMEQYTVVTMITEPITVALKEVNDTNIKGETKTEEEEEEREEQNKSSEIDEEIKTTLKLTKLVTETVDSISPNPEEEVTLSRVNYENETKIKADMTSDEFEEHEIVGNDTAMNEVDSEKLGLPNENDQMRKSDSISKTEEEIDTKVNVEEDETTRAEIAVTFDDLEDSTTAESVSQRAQDTNTTEISISRGSSDDFDFEVSKRKKRQAKEGRKRIRIGFSRKGSQRGNAGNNNRGTLKTRKILKKLYSQGKKGQQGEKAAAAAHVRRKLICRAGSLLINNFCVKCPKGTYHNVQNSRCEACPIGQYQEIEGQVECTSCPLGFSTRKVRRKNSKQCKKICPPGTYGRTTAGTNLALVPCTPCPVGSFEPREGQTSCQICPNNFTTIRRGAKSSDFCIDAAQLNDPCFNMNCRNGGTCFVNEGFAVCRCPTGFAGSFCERIFDPCGSNPCYNGGFCHVVSPQQYSCDCPSGFWGDHCEMEVNHCLSNPCNGQGQCTDLLEGFHCDCFPGFKGTTCNETIDVCQELNPCLNSGTCVAVNGSYTCICANGFSGQHCDIVYDCGDGNSECDPEAILPPTTGARDPCENFTCPGNMECQVQRTRKPTCICKEGFRGINCTQEVRLNTVLIFPKYGVSEYLMADFPDGNLTEISICTWIRTKDTFNYGTIFSYATKEEDNAFTLTDYSGLVLYVSGRYVVTDVEANDGLWHFICVTWESREGRWQVYYDGSLFSSGTQLSEGSVISGSGKLVVGQEQDVIGGGFNDVESFAGKMTRFDVWSRVLKSSEIEGFYGNCDDDDDISFGNLISWPKLLQNINGDVEEEDSTFCRGCQSNLTVYRGQIEYDFANGRKIAKYTCDEGFIIKFDSDKEAEGMKKMNSYSRVCMKFGDWHAKVPKCGRISCGFPGYFLRGNITGSSYKYGDVISYQCSEGYSLEGNGTRTCMSDGTWSGQIPRCRGNSTECKKLTAPRRGSMFVYYHDDHSNNSNSSNGSKRAYSLSHLVAGDRIEFTCNKGYILDGFGVLTCVEGGTWDREPPTCNKIRCQFPTEIAPFLPPVGVNETAEFYFDDVISFVCPSGTRQIIKCGELASWNLTANLCQTEGCRDGPPNVRNGYVVLTKPEGAIFRVGERVKVNCLPDFLMQGNDFFQCSHYGTWIQQYRTICHRASCGPPPRPPLSYVIVYEEGHNYGDKIFLQCAPGYRSLGDVVIQCQANGRYSRVRNHCIEISCGVPVLPAGYRIIGQHHGLTYGSKIWIECPGARMPLLDPSQSFLICQANGKWSSVPKCI